MEPQLIAAVSADALSGRVLAGLALILAAAFAFAGLARRVRQPAVMGEVVAGLALGPSLLGLLPGHLTDVLFPPDTRPYLQVLSQLGLVLFMFGVGYHLDLSALRGAGRQVTAISLSSVAVPFALGMGLAAALYPWFDRSTLKTDGMLAPALFLGAAMSITAFPVLARIITDRGMQRTRIGTMALACAAAQDFLAWAILAVVVVITKAAGPWPLARMALQSAVLLLALVYVVRPGLAWLLAPERRWSGSSSFAHTLLVSGLLLSAWATDEIGLHAVFGAFAFGAAVPRDRLRATAAEVPRHIEQTSLLLLPVFFTVTGLSVNIGGLGGRGLIMVVAATLVACVGKWAGATVAARLTGATRRQSAVLGVLLNARGLTELVILNVGLALGVVDPRMFTAMVVMAVVTTVMTGPLLQLLPPEEQPPSTAERTAAHRRGKARRDPHLVSSPEEK